MDCDKRLIMRVQAKLEEETEEEKNKSYAATSRVLMVKSSGRRPKKLYARFLSD